MAHDRRTRRARRSRRPDRRPGLAGTILVILVILAALTAALPGAGAVFSSTTANGANSLAFATLGTPTSLSLTAGDSSIDATWSAPTSNSAAVTGYTATASPGGASCTTGTVTLACTISGLTNGTTYTVSVVATNGTWSGSAVSSTAMPYPRTIMTGSTLNLWLDGADASTLLTSSGCTGATATSGKSIGCWLDKSASANNATQATLANQPLVSSLGPLTAPTFDGSSQYASLNANKLVTGTNPSAIFTVAVQEDTNPSGSDWRHVIGWGASGTGQGRVMEKGSFNANYWVETYATWGSVGTTTWPTSTPVVADGVITSTSVSAGMNGVSVYTYGTTNNTGTSAGAAVGATGWNTGSGVWKGRIAEVIVLAANPTSAQMRTMREYLAHKWGVTITPSAPQSASATKSGTTATVSWSAPAWNGGANVTGYTVAPVSGPGSCTWSSGTTASCSGLTAGSTYSFTVAATNSVGAGPTATTNTSGP